jgi:hypothetical protein
MASKFGWVDFSEEDRRKMLNVIHLFRERDTRDELGIGTIRDAFSDYFFPGTSTIQTRLRYMLFIPWIYLGLERKKTPSDEIIEKARKKEIQLINSLLNGDETLGVIGGDAKKSLKRLPSNVYWTGLRSWGIRLFEGSQDQYHRSLNRMYLRNRNKYSTEIDDECIDYSQIKNWHPGLPEAPNNFLKETNFSLSFNEASFIKDQILSLHSDSLLAAFIRKKAKTNVKYFWENPSVPSLSQSLSNEIIHARNFSEVIHGAPLLYNLMLSEAIGNDQWIEDFNNRLNVWGDLLVSRMKDLQSWYDNILEFWNSNTLTEVHIPIQTKRFVDKWFSFVFNSPGLRSLINNNKVRFEIITREVFLKRNRARLKNKRALELWQGEAGTTQLSYRWGNAATLLKDLFKGLREKKIA